MHDMMSRRIFHAFNLLGLISAISAGACAEPPSPPPVGACIFQVVDGTFVVTHIDDADKAKSVVVTLDFTEDLPRPPDGAIANHKGLIVEGRLPGLTIGKAYRGSRHVVGGPCPPKIYYTMNADGDDYFPKDPGISD